MYLLDSFGFLYDSLLYLSAHFSPESGFASSIPRIDVDIPPILMPFFFAAPSLKGESPALAFLADQKNLMSTADFSRILEEDEGENELRRLVLRSLFSDDIPTESDCSVKTAERLDRMGYTTDFKYRAHMCLTYFSHAVRELCRTLTVVEKQVELLHKVCKNETDGIFSELSSGKYDKIYYDTRKIRLDSFGKVTVSFSILRPSLFFADEAGGGEMRLLLGLNHIPALIEELDEDKVDLGAFLEHLGSHHRRLILTTLSSSGEMTVSDVSRQTGIPLSTTLRHMEALSDGYLIQVSSKKGLQIFYSINQNYIEKAARKTNDYLTSLLTGDDFIERNKNEQ